MVTGKEKGRCTQENKRRVMKQKEIQNQIKLMRYTKGARGSCKPGKDLLESLTYDLYSKDTREPLLSLS